MEKRSSKPAAPQMMKLLVCSPNCQESASSAYKIRGQVRSNINLNAVKLT